MSLAAKLGDKLDKISPTTQRYLDSLLQGNMLWIPHSDNRPQIAAYCSEADILYFGGAAGGGKSDLVLGLSVTAHQKSIVFRREYKQLRELVDRSTEILQGTSARYSQTMARWSDIPGGRILEFGAVQHPKDMENFKGRPHDFIGFDEIPDFTEQQFRFLMAWNRTTNPDQRCRVVCAGNPPTTPEGRWVIKYWAPWLRRDHSNKAMPGELRWFAVLDGVDVEVPSGEAFIHKGESIKPLSRTFIPAFLADNPYFNRSSYRSTLQSLPEPLRSQLLYGDFMLEAEPQLRQVIPTAWVREAQARWRADDFRATQPATAAGVDPSRGGADTTEIAPRVGTYYKSLVSFEGQEVLDGPTCVALILEVLGSEFAGVLLVDVIGIGSSVYDGLVDLDLDVVDVNFAKKSSATDKSETIKMGNVRAEAYWKFREALDPISGDDIALPPDEDLFEDLTAPRWQKTSRGLIVERKKVIRKRLTRSPGKGDAVVIAYLDSYPGVLFR